MMWSRALFSIDSQQQQQRIAIHSFSLSYIAVLNALESIHILVIYESVRSHTVSFDKKHFMLRLQNEANACAHKTNFIPTECYYLYDLLIPLHFHLQNNKFLCVRVFSCLFILSVYLTNLTTSDAYLCVVHIYSALCLL